MVAPTAGRPGKEASREGGGGAAAEAQTGGEPGGSPHPTPERCRRPRPAAGPLCGRSAGGARASPSGPSLQQGPPFASAPGPPGVWGSWPTSARGNVSCGYVMFPAREPRK